MYIELRVHSSVYMPAQLVCTGMTSLLHMHNRDVVLCWPTKVAEDQQPEEAGDQMLARDLAGIGRLEQR